MANVFFHPILVLYFTVFNVSNVIAYEKIVEELASLGDVFVTSGPMIWYQTFAKFLGVNESLLAVGDDSLKDDVEVFWLDFKLEYPGRMCNLVYGQTCIRHPTS